MSIALDCLIISGINYYRLKRSGIFRGVDGSPMFSVLRGNGTLLPSCFATVVERNVSISHKPTLTDILWPGGSEGRQKNYVR